MNKIQTKDPYPSQKEEAPCPSQSGAHLSYEIEYKLFSDELDKWRKLQCNSSTKPLGISTTARSARTSILVSQLPYAQAMALAWQFISESDHVRAVRLVKYRLEYDVKCYRKEEIEIFPIKEPIE